MNQPKQNPPSAVLVMDAEEIRRVLRRIAHEITEGNPQLEKVVLAGIPLRGVEIAQRIAAFIHDIENINVETGVIDVAMHRDDVGTRPELPVVHASKLPLPLEARTVIIVDDVLYTGRTVRAAMDAINSFGRPARILLAVLIDRGHRELSLAPMPLGNSREMEDCFGGTPKPTRQRRALPRGGDCGRNRGSDNDYTVDTQRSSRATRIVCRRTQFCSRNSRCIQRSRNARDQEGSSAAR